MENLKTLVGSLCIFGFEGQEITPWIRELIEDWNLGGVILFKRNVASREQVTQLSGELKCLAKKSSLLGSVDHEGGRVFRLPPPFTPIPPARRLAEEGKAYETGRLMGRELKEAGFNLNFAPVLDVDSNPQNPIIGDRSFSADPEQVSQCALELIRGLREEGVLPCGKHFPGHGDTSLDSHLALPIVDHPLSRLERVGFSPFRAAIEDGIEMIMTAHVLYPQIDPEFPATLSRKILTGLLREEMDYDGVVISDDLLMKGVSEKFGVPDSARLFLEAGGDLVLICKDEETQMRALDHLMTAVVDGKLSRRQLQESQQRILKMKAAFV